MVGWQNASVFIVQLDDFFVTVIIRDMVATCINCRHCSRVILGVERPVNFETVNDARRDGVFIDGVFIIVIEHVFMRRIESFFIVITSV